MNSVKILHQMSQLEDSNLVYFQRLLYTLQVSSAFQSNTKYYPHGCCFKVCGLFLNCQNYNFLPRTTY